MDIGVPHEQPEQAPVAATPQSVERLVSLGHTVHVERGVGARARIPDDDYREAGADLVDAEAAWGCDVVLAAHTPSNRELGLMRHGATLISRLDPARRPGLLENLRACGLTALAVDAVPRLSRAQAMDVLSSQANLAGYRAVIEAAAHLGRPLGGQVTAAGKFAPARVYVIGAGVAGLAGIGAARSLGAVVRGTDVRPEVAEQVESMGASFVPLPAAQEESAAREESRDGYATQMAADQAAAAAARERVRVFAERFRWRSVLAPLLEFCARPARAQDLALTGGAAGSSGLRSRAYPRPRPSAGRDLALVVEYMRAGGPREVLRRARGRVRRVLAR